MKSPIRSTRRVQLARKYPKIHARFGTPVNIIPRYVTVSFQFTGLPSTLNGMSPRTLRWNPVAGTMRSASICTPPFVSTPVALKVSISSVTMVALPALMPANRSPSGTNAMRCCHGL